MLGCWRLCSAPFEITEFLASNDRSIHDEDGDASDWIEIHNPSTTVEFLDGWSLTDDPTQLGKWRFPAGVEMQPNAFRIVFASGKNRTNALGWLHTNFRLDADGEYLALVDPAGHVVSEFPPPYRRQFVDVSFGRDVGDPTLLVYYQKPTPGERNASGGPGFAPEVIFSRSSGTFPLQQPFALTLSTYATNAVIYYAFGTNVPEANTNVGRYTGPISITNSAIVRARCFQPGLLPGPITSQTYFALAADVLNLSSPLPLIVVHNFGRGEVTGSTFSQPNHTVAVQTFESGAGRSSLGNTPAQAERGRFHIRGLSSSGQPKHSFFLEIQDEVGADKETELLGLPEESDWVLYAPYRWDPPMMHNTLAYQMMSDFGRYSPRTRYVELFLKDDSTNSLPHLTMADYNGVYVLTEKVKRDNNRVAIDSLEPEHLAEPGITGGYLLAIDNSRDGDGPSTTLGGQPLMYFVSPRNREMTNVVRSPQVTYISNYFNAFTNSLNNPALSNGAYAAYLDVDAAIDFHLLQVLTLNADGLSISTYLHKPREGRITFGPPWDFDRSQGSDPESFGGFDPRIWSGNPKFSRSPWWSRLFSAPDFWQKWIDRYEELREGPLSTNVIWGHIDRFADQLWEAQLRDQQRWGPSVRFGVKSTQNFSYDFGNPSLTNEVRFLKTWYSNRFDFLDANFLARPGISAPGGVVEPGVTVTVFPAARPNTTLFYTLDGTDPRLNGDGISPFARSNNGPLTITIRSNVFVAARCYNPAHSNQTGGDGPILSSHWSGLNTANFLVSIPPLRITEIMYHPDPRSSTNNDEEFEYLEVANVGTATLDLNHFKIRGGIDFYFSSRTLEPGAIALVVANEQSFRSRYGPMPTVAGVYSNRLDNGGEGLKLLGPHDEVIHDFRYDDDWYPITDGLGFSLEVVDASAPLTNWNFKSHWRSSGVFHGSPGVIAPPPPAFPRVVINEVLSHSDFPPPYDSVELHNLSDVAADIGGWFLTDDFENPRKYRIPPGTSVAAGGFIVFDETDFNSGNTEAFSFSSLGDEAFLFSGDTNGNLTGYVHGFDFGAQEDGVTFGRYVTAAGEDRFERQRQPTLGAANSGPAVGPIVISEIMYHPRDLWNGTNNFDNTADEFIELHNMSAAPMTLAHPDFPLNTWRLSDAVDYAFPPHTTIPAGGFVVVVSFDTGNATLVDAFRHRYDVPSAVAIYGPYSRKLDNGAERLDLSRPDTPRPIGPPDFGLVPYPLVERIDYSEESPWPLAADGYGASLQRIDVNTRGNDPANWVAAIPSPGRPHAIDSGPVINTQPADTRSVKYTTVTLNVEAFGTGRLIYQWRVNGQVVPDATNSTLVLTNLQLSQSGSYDVVISDVANSVLSESAQLTVLASVEIVRHPFAQDILPGSNVTFAVEAASSTPMTYQWQFNGTNLAGAHGASLTLSNVTAADEGNYAALVSNEISSRLSDPALLRVLVRAQMIAPVPPLRITATTNQSVALGAQTIGTLPMMYRWRRISPVSVGTVLATTLETSRTHFATFPLAGLSNGTYIYTLILSNAVQTTLTVVRTNAFVTIVADSDHDGLPDDYENEHQFESGDPRDGGMDADEDRLSNLEEFLAGTDPRDEASFLKIDFISVGAGALIQFGAVSNRTYTLEYSEQPVGSVWNKLADVLPRATNRIESILDPFPGAKRYYRLVIPKRP